jgi:hypothetical protein
MITENQEVNYYQHGSAGIAAGEPPLIERVVRVVGSNIVDLESTKDVFFVPDDDDFIPRRPFCSVKLRS